MQNMNRKPIIVALAIVMLFSILMYFFIFVNSKGDPLRDEQWYLDTSWYKANPQKTTDDQRVMIEKMAKIRNGECNTGGQTVIAIIDTGVDWTHEDLQSAMWTNVGEIPDDDIDNDNNGYVDDYYGYNFLNNSGISTSNQSGFDSHGTAIAGIIAAKNNNNRGIEGIIGDANIRIMALTVCSQSEFQNNDTIENVIAAIGYAEKEGAKICNISLNFKGPSLKLSNTIRSSKMLFVVSAGNDIPIGFSIDKQDNIPASYNYDNVITVAGLTQECKMNRQSNYGKASVDFLIAGTDIVSLNVFNSYGHYSGSSFATPMITGLAALMDQYQARLKPIEIKQYLYSFVMREDAFKEKIHSGGYIDINYLI